MTSLLNGTKWWTDRARHLEVQRARDVRDLHRERQAVDRLAERIGELYREVAHQAALIEDLRAMIENLEVELECRS